MRIVDSTLLISEIDFSTSRSSGPGGQNVNKVNSKVTLRFDLMGSTILSAEEKELLARKLQTRLTTDGILLLSSQDERTQLGNKASVVQKFDALLKKAFERRKSRKATKPSKSAVQKRIKNKKEHSEKKKWRQKPI